MTGVWNEYKISPGGRETAPSGGEREDAGPGLLTVFCQNNSRKVVRKRFVVFLERLLILGG